MKPWSFKVVRKKDGGQTIAFFFDKNEFMSTVWYPPWQNQLMRTNAQQIVDDLNAALALRIKEITNER